jgi:serine/threonine protein kinase
VADLGLREGLSRIKEEGKIMTSVGSPLWAAPEVLRGEESGSPSDVFSFAIVVYESIEWQEPYPGLSSNTIMRQVA